MTKMQRRIGLTEKRMTILRWMAIGKTNEEIGVILGVSPLTVKNVVRTLGAAYGCCGAGLRLRIVMCALVAGDLRLEEFRREFEGCTRNAGRVDRNL